MTDHRPTTAMAREARWALKHDPQPSARDIANRISARESLSDADVRRLASWFQANIGKVGGDGWADDENPSALRVAWSAHGGNAGKDWVFDLVGKLDGTAETSAGSADWVDLADARTASNNTNARRDPVATLPPYIRAVAEFLRDDELFDEDEAIAYAVQHARRMAVTQSPELTNDPVRDAQMARIAAASVRTWETADKRYGKTR